MMTATKGKFRRSVRTRPGSAMGAAEVNAAISSSLSESDMDGAVAV